ncbi:thiamine phosphate synthase [Romboutsia sp.]|uniref:thiamine phosphate synthase n=1 Tax=Romboutsia sp. TaxID=1965302 RepID=UPI003F3915F9
MDKLKVYLVTDSKILEGRDFYEAIEDSLKAGIKTIQLREKDFLGNEFLERAYNLRVLTRKYDALLIINDRVDIAMLVDADGVHVGQKDIPANEVRRLIGPDKILGVSAKNITQAKKAKEDGADYIGVGAMFTTSTKLDADSVSKDDLKKIMDEVDIPIICIGGITLENKGELDNFNVAGYAVVSAILGAENIYEESKKWMKA